MACPICKDTGQILLFTSYVECDCKINIVDLLIEDDHFLAPSGVTFAEFKGTVIQSDRTVSGYGYVIVVQTVQQQFRLMVNVGHLIGGIYRYYLRHQGGNFYCLEAERLR